MGYSICSRCGQIYNTKIVFKGYYDKCPDVLCKGAMFEVDELMTIPILTLNKKGYTTNFCCSGHIDNDDYGGYIMFKHGMSPKTTPRYWKRDKDGPNTIRYSFPKKLTLAEKYSYILKAISSLDRWCNGLTERDYFEEVNESWIKLVKERGKEDE